MGQVLAWRLAAQFVTDNRSKTDYNAPMLSLAAWQVQSSTTDPYYTSLGANTYTAPSGQPCDNAYPCSSGGGRSGLSLGAKIAIGVLVPLFVLALLGLGIWGYFQHRRNMGRRR